MRATHEDADQLARVLADVVHAAGWPADPNVASQAAEVRWARPRCRRFFRAGSCRNLRSGYVAREKATNTRLDLMLGSGLSQQCFYTLGGPQSGSPCGLSLLGLCRRLYSR